MTYDTYRMTFYICSIASTVFFLISVVLFFKLHIIKILGDLTGHNARKGVKSIREYKGNDNNTQLYSTGNLNKGRGKITDKISVSGNLNTIESKSSMNVGTEKLSDDYNATTILSNSELQTESNETTILTSEEKMTAQSEYASSDDETTVLQVNQIEGFEIEYEITFVHTNERLILN